MATLSMKLNYWDIDSIKIVFDINELKDVITSYISSLAVSKKPLDILKTVLKRYFNVSKVAVYNSNPIFAELINFIRQNDEQKKFALSSFENNRIIIKTQYRVFEEENFSVEELKKQIISYIIKKPNEIRISNIIFNSLEELTGYKANRKVTKYTKDGKNSVRIENPLYTNLFKFVQSLPEYQKNLSYVKEKNNEIQKKQKIARILQKETDFLDRQFEYHETYNNRFCIYNLR